MLGVIGHWLSKDFQYHESVLEFVEIPGRHSGENMVTTIDDVMVHDGGQPLYFIVVVWFSHIL